MLTQPDASQVHSLRYRYYWLKRSLEDLNYGERVEANYNWWTTKKKKNKIC